MMYIKIPIMTLVGTRHYSRQNDIGSTRQNQFTNKEHSKLMISKLNISLVQLLSSKWLLRSSGNQRPVSLHVSDEILRGYQV